MCQLFESIKIKNGVAFHLDLHQRRMDRSISEIYGTPNKIEIATILKQQKIPVSGLFKCRIVYDQEIKDVQLIPYRKKEIHSLRVVLADHINYHHKYTDRKMFGNLLEQHSDVDDVILLKDGFITDSSYSNLVFWNGDHWHTPSMPLLQGIQREFLLNQKRIIAVNIRLGDLRNYQKVGFINAMMDLDDMPIIETKNIKI